MNLIKNYKLDNPEFKFRFDLREILLCTLIINFLSLALPIMVLQVYDRVMINYNSYDMLVVLTVSTCFAIILEALLRCIRDYITGWGGALYEYSIVANGLRQYINADITKLKPEGPGTRIQTLASFNRLRDFYSGQAIISLIDIVFSLVFLFLIYYIAGALVLVPIFFIVVFATLNFKIGQELNTALDTQNASDDHKYNFIIEVLRGIHSVKAYGAEFIFKKKFDIIKEDVTLSSYKASMAAARSNAYNSLMNELMIIMIVAVGAPMVVYSELTTGGITATLLLSGKLMQPLSKASTLWNQYQDYKVGISSVEELFNTPQISRQGHVDKELEVQGSLSIEDLCLVQKGRILLQNINLNIQIPDIIAIHGSNNYQKTTLLKVMIGEIEASSGNVLIDGVQINHFSSDKLVNHIGFIDSDGTVFEGTIMENLTGFNTNNEPKAKYVTNLLGISKIIDALPNGFETKIGDSVVDVLSPGIKHRICIARSLINEPKIILFNNADKDLDSEGYTYLVNLLHRIKGKVSMILVTEDKRLYALASKHYIFKGAELLEVAKNNKTI
ncbi:MAG: ATP-binding cassette domain-containing protein [Rickettsiaceae bacterium]|nr:ATP-binding cassette domain-containing protein [Rickettsiaceae bacterium]